MHSGKGLSYPLSPVDYVLLVTHESLRRRGYCGLSVMLMAELDGELDTRALADAVSKLGALYPELSGHIRFSPIRRTPFWHIASDAAASKAVEFQHHALGSAHADLRGLFERCIDDVVDPSAGPQVRVIHAELGATKHWVAIRWAHPLMDMEGGHVLLRALNDLMQGRTPTVARDISTRVVSPFGSGIAATWRAWHGRALYTYYDRIHQPRIVKKPEGAPQACRIMLRHYGSDQRKAFEGLAKKRTSPGPMRYTRAAMIGAARTYLKMARERGRPRPSYVFPQPFPIAGSSPRKSIHGNHVVVAWVELKTSELEDWATADAALSKQFSEFVSKRRDAATWHMYRAAAKWPFAWTRWLTTHRLPRAAAGFTGYQFDESVTTLGSARITNICGAGAMNCHPGWMIGRTTYADRMSISITYFEDYFDTPGVEEFLTRLEHELFEE